MNSKLSINFFYVLFQGILFLSLLLMLFLSSLLLMLFSGLFNGWGRPYHATPQAALTEFPGYLTNPTSYITDSVVMLQEQPFGKGLILLYRWQSPASQQTDTYCLATTYVESEFHFHLQGQGWWAHSSAFLDDPSTSKSEHTTNPTCNTPSDAFVTGTVVRGEGRKVTTASGFDGSGRGVTVRVNWFDGHVDHLPLATNGSFFVMRPGERTVTSIDLFDAHEQRLKHQKG